MPVAFYCSFFGTLLRPLERINIASHAKAALWFLRLCTLTPDLLGKGGSIPGQHNAPSHSYNAYRAYVFEKKADILMTICVLFSVIYELLDYTITCEYALGCVLLCPFHLWDYVYLMTPGTC